MRVVVVGAGLGGLSTACRLAGAGHEVVVVERGSVPGGRAGLWETDGFSFDLGPSVMTMIDILSDVFTAAGANMADYLTFKKVDPMYRASFAGESEIRLLRGEAAMTEEIRRVCGDRDAEAFPAFCAWLTSLYEIELPHFIDRNFDSLLDMAWPLAPMVKLVRLGGLGKLQKKVNTFFEDERLRQLFSFQALYAGMSPFEALAIYGVITYMDSVEGVFFPEGGMHAIPTALASAAEKAGATFQYDSTVRSFDRDDTGRVIGITLESGESLTADVVVANPDLPVVYRQFFSDIPMPKVAEHGQYSPSCLVWHAGVRGTLPEGAAHHNIHFGADAAASFDALVNTGFRQPDPSILVCIPSITDPSQAPEGCHSLFVLEPTPNLDGNIDWTVEGEELKARLRKRVADLGYPVEDIVVERWVGPLEWEAQGMERGTPFALSHKFRQTGPFRPNNVDKRIPGLVFVGSSTLPGVGVPIVLLSGRLAAERVEEMAAR